MKPILAPAKVNPCLYLGETRSDGRHELVTVLEALTLADLLTVESGVSADEVICPGVEGPNLVSAALELLREAGWSSPPLRIRIEKRIPVAAGMGGGSSDAAAVLALADSELDTGTLARQLGADVPALVRPGLWLGTGAGDDLERVAGRLAPHAYVVVPAEGGLSTAAVYREADRLGLARGPRELADLAERVRRALADGGRFPAELTVNDLQPAAVSLAPEITVALEALTEAGADQSMVSGSGPTTVGIWWGDGCIAAAEAAAASLSQRFPGAALALPWADPSQSVSSP